MADPKKSYSDVFDDAVRRMTSTIAGNRLTRDQINIFRSNQFPDEITGEYYPPHWGQLGKANIDLGTQGDFDPFRKTVAHEGIHSILRNEPTPPPLNLINMLNNSISGHLLVPGVKAAKYAWDQSGRAGDPGEEIPAYAGAYEKNMLTDFSKPDAHDYIEAIKKFISPQAAANYQRIVNNINLARRP